jgi:hypothetical protein
MQTLKLPMERRYIRYSLPSCGFKLLLRLLQLWSMCLLQIALQMQTAI